MVPFEPQPSRAAIDSLGTNGPESTNVLRSKRGRHNIPTGDQGASLTPLENTELHATEQCAPQRSNRKRKARYSSLRTRASRSESSGLHPAPLVTSTDGGAASASDSDSNAPHTHLATDPRGKRVKRPGGVAAEQAPQPSPRAASQRHFRSKLSRVQRKLHGASHRFGLIHYLQIIISYLQCKGEQYTHVFLHR